MAELIVALDFPAADSALELAGRLRGTVPWCKVGMELFCQAGPSVLARLRDMGFHVFLDLKFYDIPHTVAQAVRAAARHGAEMLTIHTQGGERMCCEARQAADSAQPPLLFGVTVLTSFGPGQMPGIEREDGSVDRSVGSITGQCSLIMEQCPKGFSLLSGDDFTALPLMSIGGSGVISVTSNIVPGKVAAMYNAFAKGDISTAMGIHHDLFVLHQAMFMESNPIPVKTALALMGRMTDEMRLPLCPLTDEHLERLKNVLASKGLLA